MSFLEKELLFKFWAIKLKVFCKFFILKISLLFLYHLQNLELQSYILFSKVFQKKVFQERVCGLLIIQCCNCCSTTSGLEECDWGVGYSLVVVILCESYSGLKILLGEGGDVELGARTSKQISVFAIGLFVLFTCFHSLLYCRSILSQQDCIEHLKLLFRGIMRKEFRALHGVFGF